MRIAALALVSALALGACNPSAPREGAPGQAADAGGGVFPNLSQAAYRTEATISGDDGRSLPLVMIRDGRKMRLEMTTGEGQSTIISNAETGETFVIATMGGRTMALRGDSTGFKDPAESWGGELAASATRTGSCSVAGENGAEWTRTEDGVAKTACVTGDGIILRATEGGRTTWETSSVQRGPQSAELFALPPGVQVMDLGNMGAAMNEAMERAKAGRGGQ
ncbi:MAG: hypothetical protein ABL864_13475 [Terricaulis sp.]|jgi:hypothetical protein